MVRKLWTHPGPDPMRGKRAGNQDHLWDEAEFQRRSRGMTPQAKRELKRGMQRRGKRGRR